jgi:hypothetical protein
MNPRLGALLIEDAGGPLELSCCESATKPARRLPPYFTEHDGRVTVIASLNSDG